MKINFDLWWQRLLLVIFCLLLTFSLIGGFYVSAITVLASTMIVGAYQLIKWIITGK